MWLVELSVPDPYWELGKHAFFALTITDTSVELLVKAGLSPREALAAATSVPAQMFDLPDRGRIAPGLRADLVLVEGDPTIDMLATRTIAGVWKQGIEIDRLAYRRHLRQQALDEALHQELASLNQARRS